MGTMANPDVHGKTPRYRNEGAPFFAVSQVDELPRRLEWVIAGCVLDAALSETILRGTALSDTSRCDTARCDTARCDSILHGAPVCNR